MISINLTIHNKGFLLERVLQAIKTNTIINYELVCVLDGCSDNSEEVLDSFIKDNPSQKIKKLYAPDVFETISNNLAAKESSGDFIIIVQDDMIVNENGWDKRLLKPFYAFDDVFAVTARTAHNWKFNPSADLELQDGSGWSNILTHIDHADKRNLGRDIFGVRDCVNRGPLAIRKSVFDHIGGFDESFAPLDMDDHDFCYRAFKATGMRCGSYPIDYLSEDSWGGTRATGGTAPWHYLANQKNTLKVWERHSYLIESGTTRNENRKLS